MERGCRREVKRDRYIREEEGYRRDVRGERIKEKEWRKEYKGEMIGDKEQGRD